MPSMLGFARQIIYVDLPAGKPGTHESRSHRVVKA